MERLANFDVFWYDKSTGQRTATSCHVEIICYSRQFGAAPLVSKGRVAGKAAGNNRFMFSPSCVAFLLLFQYVKRLDVDLTHLYNFVKRLDCGAFDIDVGSTVVYCTAVTGHFHVPL